MAFSPDGEQFYSFGRDFYLRAYSVQTGRILSEHAIRPSGMPLKETEDGDLQLRAGGEARGPMMSEMMLFTHVAMDSNASRLVLGSGWSNTTYSFDMESGKEIDAIKSDGRANRWCISLTQDLLASIEQLPNADPDDRASLKYVLRLRHLGNEDIINEILLDGGAAFRNAMSSDGKLIAASQSEPNWTPKSKQWVDVWDAESLERVARIREIPDVRGICFSHDGTRLATSHDDATVLVWDLDELRAENMP